MRLTICIKRPPEVLRVARVAVRRDEPDILKVVGTRPAAILWSYQWFEGTSSVPNPSLVKLS